MKLQAVYFLATNNHPSPYGPSEVRDLAKLIDGAAPTVTPESWQTAPNLEAVEAIFGAWGIPPIEEDFLRRFPALKVIFYAAGSIKPFATEAMWQRGIRVTSAAGANAVPVAEYTLSQVIFCLKHGWQRVREIQQDRRFHREDGVAHGAYRSTVGLISLSRTGRLTAELLKALSVEILAYDPTVSPAEAAQLGVRLVTLSELFARSNVVSCHAPLLEVTREMLRAEHFRSMKPGATFINTARGAVVHEPGLIEVLIERPDLFALLDVTCPEPPLADSAFYTLPNVILTPHLAGSMGAEIWRMGRMIVEEAQRYVAGEPLLGEVRPEQLPLLA